MPVTRSPRIVLAGAFGSGNVGNDASLTAMVTALRQRAPARPLELLHAGDLRDGPPHGLQCRPMHAPGGPRGRLASRMADLVWMLRSFGRGDVVVVPGTGVLEERLSGGPWGMSLSLAMVIVAARARGARVALVSVGAQHATERSRRLLFRVSAALSGYRSYRDVESREAMRRNGSRVSGDRVFPDLAFGHPIEVSTVRSDGGRRLGIGVLRYYGGHDDPERGESVHRDYLAAMVEITRAVVDDGWEVVLLIGDVVDRDVADTIAVEIGRPDRVRVTGAQSYPELLREVAAADVVVASRFHNVVAAVSVGRPVVAIGYASKSADLLDAIGMGDFHQHLDDLDVSRLLAQVASAYEQREVLGARVAAGAAERRSLLAEQEQLLDAFLGVRRAVQEGSRV